MSVTLHVETGHAALFHGGKELFRRDLPAGEVARLQAIADRYRDLLKTKDNDPGLLTLGRELFHWLDGDGRDFEKVLDEVEPPLILEIRCLTRRPTPAHEQRAARPLGAAGGCKRLPGAGRTPRFQPGAQAAGAAATRGLG